MSNINDFVIKDGELVIYTGNDNEVVIPDGVTSIGAYVFRGNNHLKSVTISKGVEVIGYGAFNYCTNLLSISIPDSVTIIGNDAFYGCESIKDIVLPKKVSCIGRNAFDSCSNLTSVNIPSGMTNIDKHTFENCKNLASVTISDGVESIGWHAFYGCKSLKSVRVPDSVTQFNEDMYKYYKDYIFDENTIVIFSRYLKDIEKKHVSGRLVFCKTPVQEIKSTNAKDLAVKGFLTIEDLSVYDDEVIESYKKYLKGKVVNYAQLIIENDVEMIVRRLASLDLIDSKLVDRMMKENLSNKIKALLSENVKKTGKADGTKKSSGNNGPSITELKKTWSFSKNEEGLTITSYKGNDTKIVIPETIGKDSVTVIGDEVFSAGKKGLNASQKKARSSITEINIPDTVTAIGNGAFNGCGNLSNIKIPEGVISIGSYAFSGCKSLSSIVIPDSVTSIGSHAFQGCINLTNIGIPNNVMYIGDGAFYGCFSLKRFILPHSLKEIDNMK